MSVQGFVPRAPVTPAVVVDAAVELTRRVGLYGWSVRDLARELGTSTSAVYNHVGGRDEICRRVAQRCTAGLVLPDMDLAWDDWFREVFRVIPGMLHEFRGLAKWMIMHGPLFSGALPVIDAAIEKLREAGFGHDAALVYSTIFNTMSATIMASDERNMPGDDGPRDHRTMFALGSEYAEQSPGMRALLGYMSEYAGDERHAAQARELYLEFLLDTLLHGLARLLPSSPGK